jgi:hypothetical protein
MIQGLQLEDGKYGQRGVATSAWSDEIADFVVGSGIKEMELNDGKGWRGKDLSFLAKLPHLKALTIIDLTIPSVADIHFLRELRALEVITYCQTEIKFASFPHLEDCALEWRLKEPRFLVAERSRGCLSIGMPARMSGLSGI